MDPLICLPNIGFQTRLRLGPRRRSGRGAQAWREAVHCYMDCEVWEKAKMVAQQQCPDMIRVVEERYSGISRIRFSPFYESF